MHSLKYWLAASALIGASAFAQRPGPGPQPPDMDRMAILLDLDDYQKQEVQRIFAARREAAAEARRNFAATGQRPSREQIREQREQLRQETRTQLEGVLNASQLEKLDVLTERPRRGPGRPRGADGGRRDGPGRPDAAERPDAGAAEG